MLRAMNTNVTPLFGLSQRIPPANTDAEQALLGALLANNKAYERVSDFLAPDHFADPLNGRIFQAIQRRVEAGHLADAVTLRAEFEHSAPPTWHSCCRRWSASSMPANTAARCTTPGCAAN
jgi:hypothetical protein